MEEDGSSLLAIRQGRGHRNWMSFRVGGGGQDVRGVRGGGCPAGFWRGGFGCHWRSQGCSDQVLGECVQKGGTLLGKPNLQDVKQVDVRGGRGRTRRS